MFDMSEFYPGGPINGGYGLCYYEDGDVKLLNPLGGYFTALCDSGSVNGGSGLNASAGEGCYCTVPSPDAPPPPAAPYDDYCTFDDAYAMGGVPKEACEAWASQVYPGMQYRVDPSMDAETHGICRFIRRVPHAFLTPSSEHYGFDRVEITAVLTSYVIGLHPSNTDVCDPVGGPVGQAGACFCGFPPSAPPPPAACDSAGATAAQMTYDDCYAVFEHMQPTHTAFTPLTFERNEPGPIGICFDVITDEKIRFSSLSSAVICNVAGTTCFCDAPQTRMLVENDSVVPLNDVLCGITTTPSQVTYADCRHFHTLYAVPERRGLEWFDVWPPATPAEDDVGICWYSTTGQQVSFTDLGIYSYLEAVMCDGVTQPQVQCICQYSPPPSAPG